MVRTVLTPAAADVHLTIAEEYIGRTIEITYLALDELEQKQNNNQGIAALWNTISDKSAKKLYTDIDKMRNEWRDDI